ncbi:hypothetical protein [Dietzia sp. 111N12-1]|uniref:hypothetical protein n=1 Tax=Dietzia sp. 111N12-1 TaxID=1785156 RepID=UPI000805E54E|nr:hypothetical protein [Dietzia sp. 111N12-1]OAV78091.1 hypothetical protein AYO52_13585 [Dietzia sp. 111N12-1]
MTTGTDVLAFLGHDDTDEVLVAQADAAVRTVTSMVAAYTRGRHIDPNGDEYIGEGVDLTVVHTHREGIDDVILTAAARLVTNPTGIPYDTGGVSIRGAFQGFTLVELAVLNRYRVRAL